MFSDEVLRQWQVEEMQILRNKQPQTVNLGGGWVTQYIDLLRQFYALRGEAVVLGEESEVSKKKLERNLKELVKLEKGHGIKIRWKPSDQSFKSALISREASKATTSLDELRMSGRRRWFLLSLMKKYANGQKQAQRIIKAISKESQILKEKLKQYNASVQVLREQALTSRFSLGRKPVMPQLISTSSPRCLLYKLGREMPLRHTRFYNAQGKK